ncbi:GNAT family N-acetyltransferase [Lujinxingia litoralis]|uniref:GNAT family N-acetyltransferase n=1 Tax=Lujinxingia litoralis TaxID=2211119 RepID=A0A328CAF7_9DELT|nr:N-acetyltransferase [Lujinxingia litoralis]RAL25112.1 GNAT family N-acetyltransferase [Lujinxingia litoralis]
MQLRSYHWEDKDALFALYAGAFESDAEARLVAAFHEQPVEPLVSLIAEDGGDIVGHIALTPVRVEGLKGELAMGLAPMAVVEGRRGEGIGLALIEAGLVASRELGAVAVVVLGHPTYYPKAGFRPAQHFGLRSEYDVPPEVFMAVELVPGALREAAGLVRYHALFADL